MEKPLELTVAEMLTHSRWVEDLARRLTDDPMSADDLAQTTWVIALEHARKPPRNLRGWLARTMRNLVRERARRESARAGVEVRAARGEELPSTEELVARADAERALVEAVLALDDPYKKTLLLRYFEGLPPDEIARREGVPTATVASRITRAHAKLRESLGARGGDRSWPAIVATILDRIHRHPPLLPRVLIMSTALKIALPAAAVLVGLAWYLRSSGSSDSPARPADIAERVPTLAAEPERKAPTANRESAAPEPPVVAVPVAAPAPVIADTGRIHGRVVRIDGAPASLRKIHLLLAERNQKLEFTADEKGSFAARDLHPGAWMLSTWPDSDELAALGKDDTSAGAGFGYLVTRNVEVAAGADVEVLIGAPPANPIHVTGVVSLPTNSKGVHQGVDLMWVPPGEGALGRQKRAHADDSGRYEVVLEDPGRYAVLLGGFSMQGVFDAVVDIPKEREVKRDFAVPAGVVRGRAVGPDGSPAASATVSLLLRGGRIQSSLLMGRGMPVTTDKEGRFDLEGVRPGTYALVVSPRPSSSGGDSLAMTGPLEIKLGDAEVREGLEIALIAGFAGSGTVVGSDGNPAEASVFVFDDHGEPLNAIDPVRVDKAGKFVLTALGPGRYGIVALHDDAASAVQEFEIGSAGLAAPLALALSPGAIVRVEATAAAGTIQLRDAGDHDFAPLLDTFALLLGIRRTWSADVHEFRVPAGNYTVLTVEKGARTAVSRLSVLAGEERRIVLAR